MLGACTAEKTSPSDAPEKKAQSVAPAVFKIVFDLSKEQIYSPFDSHFAGMSQLTEALRKEGAEVSVNFRDLRTLTQQFKGPGHILVLGPALERKYAPEDLEAIYSFRRSGGGVLVIAEHDNFFRHADMHNALTEAWGIKYEPRPPTEKAEASMKSSGLFLTATDWASKHTADDRGTAQTDSGCPTADQSRQTLSSLGGSGGCDQ